MGLSNPMKVLMALSLLMLVGCASRGDVVQPVQQPDASIDAPQMPVSADDKLVLKPEGWWQVGFRIYWEQVADKYAEEEKAEEEVVEELPLCRDPALEDVSEEALADAGDVKAGEAVIAKEDETTKAEPPVEDKEFIQPSWHVGSLIADQVLAPLIKQHGNDIFMWRFHRRAGNDAKGHQFSFIFYTDQQQADKVIAQIQAHPLVVQMLEEGVLHKMAYPETDKIDKPLLSDTADKKWPDEIKKSWPLFIMGASQMWLMQLETIAQAHEDYQEDMSLEEMLAFYEDVQLTMDEMWREQARHAYFHHMSGLYAYEKVLVGF